MLPLAKHTLDVVALVAVAGAVVALLLAAAAHVRLARIGRGLRLLDSGDGGDGQRSVLDVLGSSRRETEELRSQIAATRSEVERARADLADALRHVAVVRYDAFGDMGGRLSFTAALLDDSGDGLVLTSIHGRSEARTYAKGVKAGSSEQSLSPEEEESIRVAMRGDSRGDSGAR